MKISYNNWAYTAFFVWVPAYTLDETIKRLAKMGYDGIEIGAGADLDAVIAHLGEALDGLVERVGGDPHEERGVGPVVVGDLHFTAGGWTRTWRRCPS